MTITACPSCGQKNRVPAAAHGTPRCGACAGPLPWVVAASDADWAEVVDRASVPVLVDFWAEWCGPCRMVSPILETLAEQFAGRVKLAKVDVDASPVTASRFGIQGIPTLAVFRDGQVVARRTGATGQEELSRWLERSLTDSGQT